MTQKQTPTDVRGTFFDIVFQGLSGYLAIGEGTTSGGIADRYFHWPDERQAALDFIETQTHARSLFFCPHLFDKRKRLKDNVIDQARVAYADLDECPPEIIKPQPSFAVQTSPDRWQAYWVFDQPVDVLFAESVSQRAYMTYRSSGVDSGWALTKYLRIPLTVNFKPKYKQEDGTRPIVSSPLGDGTLFLPEDFDHWDRGVDDIARPTAPPIPDVSNLDPKVILRKYNNVIRSHIEGLLEPQSVGNRSDTLYALHMTCFEAGMTAEEVFAISLSAPYNKFVHEKRIKFLWEREIAKAEARAVERFPMIPSSEIHPLITQEEKAIVGKMKPTFIDKYLAWANDLTDAPSDYHIAAALTCLSSVLAESAVIKLRQGIYKLNLWCLILADTTVTRKSTAMQYCRNIMQSVNPDAIAATEATVEGLLTELSKRPAKTSVFYRDEVSGWFASFKKDYMSGLAASMANLYDGDYQKRVLRKETIEVRDPIFIIFAGGAISDTLEQANEEMIRSGFLPRFMYFVGESDPRNFRSLSQATDEDEEKRADLIAELSDIRQRYDRSMVVKTKNHAAVGGEQEPFPVRFTPEAWNRREELEMQLTTEGVESTSSEIFTPMLVRLSHNIMKVAALLAASRQDPRKNDPDDPHVLVEMNDMLKALSYAEMWRKNALFVVSGIGKTSNEKLLERVVEYVESNNGVLKSAVMQRFRLMSKDAGHLVDTLADRGLINVVVPKGARNGRGTLLLPVKTKGKE